MELDTIIKTYGAFGAGGVALIALIWLLIYLVTRIHPLLISLKEDNRVQTEVIKNNTDAIREVSKSNENVATALQLLNQSFDTFAIILEKHDERAQKIEIEIIRMNEAIKK